MAGGITASQVMEVRLSHPKNAVSPMLVTFAGITIVVKPVWSNA